MGMIQKSWRCVWYGPISSTSSRIATKTPAIPGCRSGTSRATPTRPTARRAGPRRLRAALRDLRATTLHPLPLATLVPPATLSPALWGHIVAQHGPNGGDDHHRKSTETPARPRPRLDRLDRHAGARRDRAPPERFRVVGLAAGGSDVALLAAQAAAHGVRRVAVADPGAAARAAPGAAAASSARGPGRRHRAHRHDARRHGAQRHHRRASAWPRRWPRWPPARRWRWRTRSRWSPAARWSRRRPRPARSSRSTPSTPRSPSACAAAAADEVARLVLTASGGPFRGGGATSWPASPRSRRWRTRPGPWARWSRSTPRRWSTRASR